jgi:5'(3')-deoxyribonucleotidase
MEKLNKINKMRYLAGLITNLNEDVKHKVQVWFDLDGVLADMNGSLEKDETYNNYKNDLDNVLLKDFPEFINLKNDELRQKINDALKIDPNNIKFNSLKKKYKDYNNYVFKIAGKGGFYASLDLMPGAVDLVKKANDIVGKKSNILTAPAGNENDPNNPSVIEKNQWVKDNFGDLVDHIEITIDKGRVVKSKYDILIDDRTKYVDKFVSAGGSAILYKDANQAASDLQKLYDELMSGN